MVNRRGLLALVFVLACAAAVHAFRFEPISQDFAPTGPQANRLFRVSNPGNERMAIRVTIHSRTVNRDGSEILGRESPDFIVFPRQFFVGPGENRSVRVRFQGTAPTDRELAYRIVAEQLPVEDGQNLPTQGGGIQLTYRYEGTVYVVPPGARPMVRVTSALRERRDDTDIIRVTVANSGGRHRILSGIQLALADSADGEPRIVLSADQLPGMAGQNVLAGGTRDFLIPAPENMWFGSVHATILPAD